MLHGLINYRKNQKGQGLTEYAMILGLASIAAIATLTLFGNIIVETFFNVINDTIAGL